jgi:hypothetical protein
MGVGWCLWSERGVVGQPKCNGLRPGCLIAINSLRGKTEATVVARCLAGTLLHSEVKI